MDDSKKEENNIPNPKDSTIENDENPPESLNKDNIKIKEDNNNNESNINNNQENNLGNNNSDNFNENNQFPNADEDNFEQKDENNEDKNNKNDKDKNIFEDKDNIDNKNNGNNNKEENINDEEKIDESNNNENNNNNSIRFSSIKNDDINNSNNNNNEPSGFVYDEENEDENKNNSQGNETNKNFNEKDETDNDFGFRESNNNGFDNHNYENDFDFDNNQNNFINNQNNNNNNNNNNFNVENNQNNNQENKNNLNNFNFNYFNNNNHNNPFAFNNNNNNNNINNNFIQNGGNNYGQNNTNQTETHFIPQETPIFNNLNNNNFAIDQNQEDMHPDYDPQYKQYIEFPEDSDGINLDPHKMGTDSSKTTGVQIANTIMGAGILSIPIIMRYLGIIIGSLFIIFLALSTIYSVYVLIRCHQITGKYGFSMLGKITMGNFGNILIKIIIIINNIGLCIAYFRIFGEVVQTIIQGWVSPDSFWATNWHNYFFILLCGIIMIFFIFKKNISSLKKVAYLGVCAVLLFSLSLVVLLIYKSSKNYLGTEIIWDYLIPNCTFSEAFHAIPTVFLAFLFQFNVFPIYLSLKHRKIETMMKATKLGVGFSLIIFLIVGIVGFLIYGQSMEETILNSFSEDMIKYRNKSTFIKVLIIIICITFVTTCLTSFPILFLSLKENFFNSILFCFKNCCKKSHNNEEVQISQGKYEKKKYIGKKGMKLIIFILYFLILAMAIVLPKLKIIFSVVGATAGTFIAFILPNLFYIRICKMSGKSYNIVLPLIFFAFGLFFLIVSITITFI
jgi:amino acid permease